MLIVIIVEFTNLIQPVHFKAIGAKVLFVFDKLSNIVEIKYLFFKQNTGRVIDIHIVTVYASSLL